MARIILATTTCKRFLYKVDVIRKSWLYNSADVKHLFFIGGDVEEKNNDIVTLNCDDSYNFLTQKTRKMFEYCLKYEDFDYIVKTNDDSFVDINKFLATNYELYDYGGYICSKQIKFLEGKTNEFNYDDLSIHCNKEFLDGKIFNYGTGGFYFISKKAVQVCLESKTPGIMAAFDNTSVEDLIVGVLLHNNFKDLKILNLNHKPKINLPYDICTDGLSIHPVHHKIMRDLYNNNFVNQQTILKYKSYLSDYLKK